MTKTSENLKKGTHLQKILKKKFKWTIKNLPRSRPNQKEHEPYSAI